MNINLNQFINKIVNLMFFDVLLSWGLKRREDEVRITLSKVSEVAKGERGKEDDTYGGYGSIRVVTEISPLHTYWKQKYT